VEDEVTARRDSIRQQLTYAGMTEAQYLESEGQSDEEFAAELESRVRASLAAQFVLDEIAKAEELSVAEEELTEHLVRRATQAGVQPQDFVQQVVQNGQVPALVAEVVRGKALALVVESAKVTDESARAVDLKNLQPDGSLQTGTPDAEAASAGPPTG
jgi:trigger factor